MRLRTQLPQNKTLFRSCAKLQTSPLPQTEKAAAENRFKDRIEQLESQLNHRTVQNEVVAVVPLSFIYFAIASFSYHVILDRGACRWSRHLTSFAGPPLESK